VIALALVLVLVLVLRRRPCFERPLGLRAEVGRQVVALIVRPPHALSGHRGGGAARGVAEFRRRQERPVVPGAHRLADDDPHAQAEGGGLQRLGHRRPGLRRGRRLQLHREPETLHAIEVQ
jgi:hypothetical protein